MASADQPEPTPVRTLAEAAASAGVGLVVRALVEEAHRIAAKLHIRLRAHGAPASTAVAVTWRVGETHAQIVACDESELVRPVEPPSPHAPVLTAPKRKR